MTTPQNETFRETRRVLFFAEAWGLGGIETFMMNVVRRLDSSEFQFEILSVYDWDDSYDAELSNLNVRRETVFHGVKPSLVRRFFSGIRAFARALREGDFDIVHINIMNGVGLVYAGIAQRAGVPRVIVHSHNSNFGSGHVLVKSFIHRGTRLLLGSLPDIRLACSDEAGQYLFGNRDFQVINNGIDTERFQFNADDRDAVRKAQSIPPNALVVGTVGRLSYQKNPLFQIEIMNEIIKANPRAVFLHVGDGEMRSEVEALCEKLAITENCRFITRTLSTHKYLSAMDYFIFPSLYEGLPIAPIEAQCNGVISYLSDRIPPEAIITEIATRIPLDSASSWAKQITTPHREDDRMKYAKIVERSNFGLDYMSSQIRSRYC